MALSKWAYDAGCSLFPVTEQAVVLKIWIHEWLHIISPVSAFTYNAQDQGSNTESNTASLFSPHEITSQSSTSTSASIRLKVQSGKKTTTDKEWWIEKETKIYWRAEVILVARWKRWGGWRMEGMWKQVGRKKTDRGIMEDGTCLAAPRARTVGGQGRWVVVLKWFLTESFLTWRFTQALSSSGRTRVNDPFHLSWIFIWWERSQAAAENDKSLSPKQLPTFCSHLLLHPVSTCNCLPSDLRSCLRLIV